jgi:small-conductance mechanosensitive channel
MNWQVYAAIFGPLAIFFLFDIFMRFQPQTSQRDQSVKLRFMESTFAIFYIGYLAVLTGNLGLFGIIGTFIVAFAFVFQPTLLNLGSTLLLMMYPQITQGDIVTFGTGPDEQNLLFQRVGFMRSGLQAADGHLVMVPNSTLLNSEITIS